MTEPANDTPATELKVKSEFNEIVNHLLAARWGANYNMDFPLAIVPNGVNALNLEKFMPRPMRIRKDLTFTEMESFLNYFHHFDAGYEPQLFVKDDTQGMTLLCIFDYDVSNKPGLIEEVEGKETVTKAPTLVVPQWNDHVAKLVLQYHPDYLTLRQNDNKWFTQEDFALFIEENTHLFSTPSGADMLELAQEIKGIQSAEWTQGKRLSNGATKLGYVETVTATGAKGEMEVPAFLIFNTPLFDGAVSESVRAAFRWKFSDRKVTFSYRLLTKLQERNTKKLVRDNVATETGLTPLAVSAFDGIRFDRAKL